MPKRVRSATESQPEPPASCAACAELGMRFHFSFPEDPSAPHPASFAHLGNVAHSIISFRDELVRCDVCHAYFAWNRMWDNDVYSTPLDYVDIYRLTPQEAKEWLQREKRWAQKERAAERREIRKLRNLWADEVGKLDVDERAIFDFLVEKRSRGEVGEKIKAACGVEDPAAMWKALASLQQKNIVRRSQDSTSREHASYQVSAWKHNLPGPAPTPEIDTPAPSVSKGEHRRCPKCGADGFHREFGATPDGAPYASDHCAKCGELLTWYDEWNLPDE